MSERLSIEAKLGLNTFKVADKPHLIPDQDGCKKCREKWCLHICPAKLYTLTPEGEIHVNWEGCLECGTCLIACSPHGLRWECPPSGFGVQYRFG